MTSKTEIVSAEPTTPTTNNGDRVVGGAMLWVAVRCTLQYVLLPFVLPLIGLNDSFSAWLSAAISLFALGMMVFNIRRLWPTSWRWRYLALSAVTGSIIVLFLALDIQALWGVK